jgi:excisionase family DNA binding protein
MTPLLTIPQVAERTQLSTATIYRAIRDGDLAAKSLRSSYRVEATELERWIAESVVEPREPEQRPRRRPRRRAATPVGTFGARLKAIEGGRG